MENPPASTSTPLPRRAKVLLFAIGAAAVIVVFAWLAAATAPVQSNPTTMIANATDLEISPGASNAVVFPFLLAPDSQSDDDGSLVVTTATASVTIAVPACQQSVDVACPGVTVEILPATQVDTFGAQSNLTPIWCTNTTVSACATTTDGSYTMDLTSYAGDPLALIVWSGSGVEWVDVSAQGTWSD
jgi:hypothetical protein